MRMPDGAWMPFIGADMARVESLRPLAKDLAKAAGVEYKILRFVVEEEMEK
jgi:hypothetical protein